METRRERFLTAGEAYVAVFCLPAPGFFERKNLFTAVAFQLRGTLGENKMRCQSCSEHTNRERCLLLNMSGDWSSDTSPFGLEVNGERQKARERERELCLTCSLA